MTSFEKQVYAYVATIPQGRVVSYKQVARAIGHPGAYRAVGNALHKNRSSAVPCHRVIASDGTLGGYVDGKKKKRSLLRAEGAIDETGNVMWYTGNNK